MVCDIVVRVLARHAEENLGAIKEQMDSSARIASEIMGLSEELADKFDVARERAEVLTESMNNSHDSVKEIAGSVRVTAEASSDQNDQQYPGQPAEWRLSLPALQVFLTRLTC